MFNGDGLEGHSKYGIQKNGWGAELALRSNFRSPWKSISRVYPYFMQLIKVQIGNGKMVRFWEEKCLGREKP